MLYLVKKPYWITSNLVIKILKRVLDVKKIGFAGTLDPLATGLMLVGTHGSPRLFPMIENFTKTYRTTIRLDGTTESYDLEKPVQKKEINEKIISSITVLKLEDIIQKNFIGEINQVPPLYSATWIDWKRAYERVRKWEKNLIIPAKNRTIHSFNIVSYQWPNIDCIITVSHGTYIRSIARDLWEILWTGWYLSNLERSDIGHISIEKEGVWIQHNDIIYISLSHAELFPNIPHITLSDQERDYLKIGSTPISNKGEDWYFLLQYDKNTFGLLERKNETIFPLKNSV